MTTPLVGRFDGDAAYPSAFEFCKSFRFEIAGLRGKPSRATQSLERARWPARACCRTPRAESIDSPRRSANAACRIRPSWMANARGTCTASAERLLVERLGDAGRRLHTPSARKRAVSLDLRLYLCCTLPTFHRGVAAVISSLAARARRRATPNAGLHPLPRGPAGALLAFFSLTSAALRRYTSGLPARAPKPTRITLGSAGRRHELRHR